MNEKVGPTYYETHHAFIKLIPLTRLNNNNNIQFSIYMLNFKENVRTFRITFDSFGKILLITCIFQLK